MVRSLGALLKHTSQGRFDPSRVHSSRQVEYKALVRVMKQLHVASVSDERREKIKAAYMAVEVWSVFLDDLTGQGNLLPDIMKADLISLGLFVVKSCGSVLSGSDGLDDVSFITSAIMKGLREG